MKTNTNVRRQCWLAIAMVAGIFCCTPSTAQRLSTTNTIGWLGSFNTIYLSKKVSLWAEYQFRRVNFLKDPQQQFFRGGIQYHFNKDISGMVGYAYVATFPYGDYPFGKYSFPEHRIFEQIMWNDNRGRVTLNHRLRIEQRFMGKVDQTAPTYEVLSSFYVNRVRYQLRLNCPLNRPKMQDKTWYAAVFDEILIGFGKNVNQNVFDQNRLGILAGYQFNDMLKTEVGFLNQILLQPAPVNGKQVYQYNSGLQVSLLFTKPYKTKKQVATN